MKRTTRIARALACATLLAIPTAALADGTASIRAEGVNGTVLPERAGNVPTGGTTTLVDPDTPSNVTVVANNSGTSLLLRSAQAAGVSIGFNVFVFGGVGSAMIMRIGPEASPLDWSWSWAIKVNHAMAQVGSDDVVIHPGDQILWMPSTFGVAAPELDITGPAAPVANGAQFAVHVTAYDDNAVATPGSGVTVTYGGQVATTDAQGNATLTAQAGWGDIVASAPGSIRDEARACGFAADHPEACGLDPLAQLLPEVAPNTDLSSVPSNKVTVTTSTGKTIDVQLPAPVRGTTPVSITAADLAGQGLTPDEQREALRQLASGLAWQLNSRAADGDTSVTPPAGTRWRAAWLGRATTVAPLAPGEAVVAQRSQSRAHAQANGDLADSSNRQLAACGLDTHAVVVRRFGYSMVVVQAPATGARACLAHAQ